MLNILVVSALAVLFFIVLTLYILNALGLSKMAKTLKIKNGWFAYIPFFNQFLKGKIADTVNTTRQKKSLFKMFLPVSAAVVFIMMIAVQIITARELPSIFDASKQAYYNGTTITAADFAPLKSLIMPAVLYVVFAICYKIERLAATYRIYDRFDTQNKKVFTVIGVFFDVLTPLFIFTSAQKSAEDEAQKSDE